MKLLIVIWLYTFQILIDAIAVIVQFTAWAFMGFPAYDAGKEIEYKPDPLYGAINYNWVFKFQATVCGYKGDCDKQATHWKWCIHGGSRYSIFPTSLKNIRQAHVVYAYKTHKADGVHTFVCSNNRCYEMSLDEYVNRAFDIDVVVVEMPY